jgi:hypothetical protein
LKKREDIVPKKNSFSMYDNVRHKYHVPVLKLTGVLILKLLGDCTVAGATTACGKRIFSVYQFINVVCGESGDYSEKELVRLVERSRQRAKSRRLKFVNDLKTFKFPMDDPDLSGGPSRRRNSPAMTVDGLWKLLPMLGNKVLPDVREQVERELESIMNGDRRMIETVDSA